MQDAKKDARSEQIEEAAYAVLAEKGFAGASMLSIAKRAKCSNETMYRWYGDKVGLFRALVTRNADQAADVLRDAAAEDRDPMTMLEHFGPVLLDVLLGEKAVALNRAAAADGSGVLGLTLAAAGRDTVQPLIVAVMERAIGQRAISGPAEAACDLYLSLLIGDWQIRRVVARVPAPSTEMCIGRAKRAVQGLRALMPAK
ncbi:TetR/AcrR family transcriptional regulator [Donghicola sp. XS_ASV15]|uniref:TetR/AcrR family transcriptional regulator n=1 Tax=Donghicola sp. XS_ASV15 TaxID=3241295 RepID=UPI003517D71F